jgi:hypothetical protein
MPAHTNTCDINIGSPSIVSQRPTIGKIFTAAGVAVQRNPTCYFYPKRVNPSMIIIRPFFVKKGKGVLVCCSNGFAMSMRLWTENNQSSNAHRSK